MPEPVQTVTITGPVLSANELLARQITQALRDAEFIGASDEADVLTMLTVGSTRAGDWLQLLEKNVNSNSTPTDEDHAATNHSA